MELNWAELFTELGEENRDGDWNYDDLAANDNGRDCAKCEDVDCADCCARIYLNHPGPAL